MPVGRGQRDFQVAEQRIAGQDHLRVAWISNELGSADARELVDEERRGDQRAADRSEYRLGPGLVEQDRCDSGSINDGAAHLSTCERLRWTRPGTSSRGGVIVPTAPLTSCAGRVRSIFLARA